MELSGDDAKKQLVRLWPLLRGVTLVRSSLNDIGWYRSAKEGLPVDQSGRPVPWVTYPAIHLLKDRVPRDADVFEYGAGNSTLWWAERSQRVVACEHDSGWAERSRQLAPSNVRIVHRDLDDGTRYEECVLEHGKFDVVVIDGRKRVDCAGSALQALSARGVIVWDNSDREKYRSGFEFLSAHGLRQLDLWGLAPGIDHWGSTSIFYKDGNCLGI